MIPGSVVTGDDSRSLAPPRQRSRQSTEACRRCRRKMPWALPVRCTGLSPTETTRSSRLTTSLPVRIVDSEWSLERRTIAWIHPYRGVEGNLF
jgi:hypothetical protein